MAAHLRRERPDPMSLRRATTALARLRLPISPTEVVFVLLCQLLPPLAQAAQPSLSTPGLTAQIRAYRTAHEKEILGEFVSLLAIPNHASDEVHIRDNAAAIVRLLELRHIKTTLLEYPGSSPAVLGELSVPGARRTVTFYAHYDGQPVDARSWRTDPFAPELWTDATRTAQRIDLNQIQSPLNPEWRLYARSASDDKAPIIGFLTALDALRAAGVTPSVNLKFFFEGEEEIGSPHLEAILERYAKTLSTDLWILCDGPRSQTGQMQVYFGARGAMSLNITVYGPNHGLHSGHYGNWAPNPIIMLTHLLDSMRDDDARILISGLYDDVRPMSPSERQITQSLGTHDAELKQALGIVRTEGEPATLAEQLMKPALNVHGILGGHVGSDAANVIESEAHASIDFRLVPNQTPTSVRALVERHIAEQGYWLARKAPEDKERQEHARIALLQWDPGAYAGWRTPMDLAVSHSVVSIIEDTLQGDVIRVPSLGGSIPMYLFAGRSEQPVIGVPIANYDNNQHTANENIRLGNLWAGIEIYAALFAKLDGAGSAVQQGPFRRSGIRNWP